jgi:glycine amidinotransferase
MGPVNSYTEWSKLEEVILGSHYNTGIGNIDISARLLYHDNLARARRIDPARHYTIDRRHIEEREEDVAGLEQILTGLGIVVRRPLPLEEVHEFSTPAWRGMTKACDNPRDQVLIIGDLIIETSCCLRNRYFENDLLKPIFYDYFRRGARWVCSPRPVMSEASFDPSYAQPEKQTDPARFEMMFDAAQCLRFGKDILFNVRTQNHELGFRWLASLLGDRFRLHPVQVVDNHLDGGLMPLRPGKLLVTERVGASLDKLPAPLRRWDVLQLADLDPSQYPSDAVLLASNRINVNVLSLDERRVLINEQATRTMRLLEKHGFEPIPVRLRHCRIFGGGLHCVSLDIRRAETLDDYFA